MKDQCEEQAKEAKEGQKKLFSLLCTGIRSERYFANIWFSSRYYIISHLFLGAPTYTDISRTPTHAAAALAGMVSWNKGKRRRRETPKHPFLPSFVTLFLTTP